MALIEEATAEAERDIEEGIELLAGAETETDYTQNENVIHTETEVPTEENTYNLWRRVNHRPEYTHRYGFQATLIHYAFTQPSMKRKLKNFKQKDKKAVTADLENLHRRDAFQTIRTEDLSEKYKHELLALLIFLKEKMIWVNKGSWSSRWEKSTREDQTKWRYISDSINGSSHAQIDNLHTRGKRRGSGRHTRRIFERKYG